MKKRVIRLLAMVLCVMTFVSLLPPAALAADADTDPIQEAVVNAAKAIKQGVSASKKVHKVEESYKYELKVPRTSTVMLVDFNYYRHGSSAYPFAVRFYWYYRKPGKTKWVRVKKASKYFIRFSAKGKNGYSYKLKTVERKDSGHVMLYTVWKIKTY